jgi:hypothetical protein
MTNAEEDEWEYEYDETETEYFYIPIDLSHVSTAQRPVADVPKLGHPILLQTRLRALNERREAENIISSLSISEDSTSLGKIQVSGLHTANPLIMYNDQLLSCQWGRNVGTDMFFAKPNPNSDRDEALRSLPDVDLIATGSTKLIASAARLRPREDLFDGMVDHEQAEQPREALQPNENGGDEKGTAPSSFLAKLNAAKAKRGESSRLVVSRTTDGTRLATETRAEEPVLDVEDSVHDEEGNTVMTNN